MSPTVLVTFSADPDARAVIETELPDDADCHYLDDLPEGRHGAAVAGADALLSMLPHRELDDEAVASLHEDQIVQTVTAGVDHIPLERLPDGLRLLSNAGAYAEPIAEHVLAMYLALSKRLRIEHQKLRNGTFDQFQPTLEVDGSTCGIFGYGGIGQAAARLLKPLGVSILAINRRGEAAEPAEFIGTPDRLDHVLERSDGVVLSAPLTPETRGIIDREKLRTMPVDGMIVNVARGELIDQHDLYEHLRENPEFQAGIDAWWTEPLRHGAFELEHPFLELPNVVGSPHNASQVPGIRERGLRQAARNLAAALKTGTPGNVVDRETGY